MFSCCCFFYGSQMYPYVIFVISERRIFSQSINLGRKKWREKFFFIIILFQPKNQDWDSQFQQQVKTKQKIRYDTNSIKNRNIYYYCCSTTTTKKVGTKINCINGIKIHLITNKHTHTHKNNLFDRLDSNVWCVCVLGTFFENFILFIFFIL